jgi:hypothetical protein
MLSNRETTTLYRHLSAQPMDPQIIKLIEDALDDVRSEPDLWSDFKRQAVRALATTLRATIEGMFEDFYFGSEKARTPKMARMCSDVGSLWRVHWTEIAERLYDDGGFTLESPE